MNYCLNGDFIKYSNIHGRIDIGTSKLFDDSQDLGGTEESFLQYMIKKIKIYTKKVNNKKYIDAIQLIYRNIKTSEIKELPIRGKNKLYPEEDVEVFELKPGEFFTNVNMVIPLKLEHIYQIGFETNKHRQLLVGSEEGKDNEDKNIINNDGNYYNIILGTFGYYNKKMDSLGLYYISLKEYIKKYYIGYFELNHKLKKNEIFRKELEKKYETLNLEEKFLYKACLLPSGAFNEIVKYCIL